MEVIRSQSRWAVACLWLVLAGAAFVGAQGTAVAQETAEAPPLILILDASGSMWGQIDGENKIVVARRSLGRLADELADATEVSLLAYGHRREGDCEDIEVVMPLGPLDREALKSKVEGISPKGKTPITAAVGRALETVKGRGSGTVILLSDGLETCGGDPCRAVIAAKEAGLDLVLHVVGFGLEDEDLSQLQCVAQAGGGLFFHAENAEGLSRALDAAVALTVDVPAGRLVVHGVADDALHDVAVEVTRADGESVAVARTYKGPETNPASIPLADGSYGVRAVGIGLRGSPEQSFEIEITDGGTVERTVDFSTGVLSIGVDRNGALSDAVYKVYGVGTRDEVASGRTYDRPASNPAQVRLTAGRYDVEIKSVEITGRPGVSLGTVEVPPKGSVEARHSFESGTLKVGAVRGAERIDSIVKVIDQSSGKAVGQSRTYTGPPSNPKTFELELGSYRIEVNSFLEGRPSRTLEVTIEAGKTTELDADFGS